MAKITIKTKFSRYNYSLNMAKGREIEYYRFVSREEIIKEGQKVPKLEINIDKKHAIFSGLEVKSHFDNNDVEIYPYLITFEDNEKYKPVDGADCERKRYLDEEDKINIVEKIEQEKDNDPDHIPTDEEIKVMEDLLAFMKREEAAGRTSEEDKKEIKKLEAAKKKKKPADQWRGWTEWQKRNQLCFMNRISGCRAADYCSNRLNYV